MKKQLLLILILLVSIPSFAWKPIFVGHRGSSTGVANTAEAFRNGVDKYGYQGLECDVRVTSDREYVICHDETTNSLGGNLTVATSTLEQLKAENLTQTRSGVTYTGKICTVAEYLDICNKKNAFPLIELKWATGINNNSMSNFPGLLELVDKKGLRSKAIFLTSMQSSLEYIRKNYPDVQCQYLISNPNDARFNWCLKWGVNASIQSGKFDQNLVIKYHQKGLKVAMWTVNSESNYKKYGEWGVYMMTCDYLPAKDMPDLPEIDWDKFPEILDPIALDTEILWERSVIKNNLPAKYPTKGSQPYNTGQQAAIVDGKFYVNDYGTENLLIMDKDCTEVTAIPKEEMLGGSSAMGITSDDAGNIIQRYENGYLEKPSTIKLFKKNSETTSTITFSLINTGQTNFVFASGDVFSAEGGYIYLYPKGQKEVYTLEVKEGKLISMKSVNNLSIAASTAGIVIPINNNPTNFIYQVRNYGFYLVNGTDKGDYLTGGASTEVPSRNSSLGGAFIKIDGHDLLIHPSGTNYNGGFSIKDMSADGATLKTFSPLGDKGYGANSSTGSFMKAVKVKEDCYILYVYTMGAGYGAYQIAKKGSGIEPTVDDIKSNSIIYPNPVEDVITIKNSESIKDIKIFNLAGAMVYNHNGNNNNLQTLDISILEKGTYLLKINDNEVHKLLKK